MICRVCKGAGFVTLSPLEPGGLCDTEDCQWCDGEGRDDIYGDEVDECDE